MMVTSMIQQNTCTMSDSMSLDITDIIHMEPSKETPNQTIAENLQVRVNTWKEAL